MVKPLTLAQAKNQDIDTFYMIGHYNADGSPMSYRRNGKTQLWKTRPDDFRIPVKRGLYEYGEITPHNMDLITIERPASIPKKEVYKGKRK